MINIVEFDESYVESVEVEGIKCFETETIGVAVTVHHESGNCVIIKAADPIVYLCKVEGEFDELHYLAAEMMDDVGYQINEDILQDLVDFSSIVNGTMQDLEKHIRKEHNNIIAYLA
jgi:hypothetical protein